MSAFTLSDLAKITQAEIKGDANGVITGIAPIASAQKGQLTYLANRAYKKYLSQTQASVVLLAAEFLSECPVDALVVKNPEAAFARIAELFAQPQKWKAGVHLSAVVGKSCRIDPSATVAANCVLGDRVTIGARSVIQPGTVIGNDCTIGEDCMLQAKAVLYHQIKIGNRVIIQSGAVLGSDGFGYAEEEGKWIKIPQLGGVLIEDDVEVGALASVDRGALQDTILRRGVKIDNYVQVAHNVEIGEHTVIAGCTAIAGSTKIGRHCMIGGAACINGHITIGDNVIITGAATVLSSIEEPGIYTCAIDARPHREWGRTVARLHRLDDLAKQVVKMEKEA